MTARVEHSDQLTGNPQVQSRQAQWLSIKWQAVQRHELCSCLVPNTIAYHPHIYAAGGATGAAYAGDVDPASALSAVADGALIVDVRTRAEWSFVGLPNLGQEQMILSEWQRFPDMQLNPDFTREVASRVATISGSDVPADAPALYFLCRSGGRSQAAAMAMTAVGFPACYNISGGFEGDPDGQGHRGQVNGWKADGLPWAQS